MLLSPCVLPFKANRRPSPPAIMPLDCRGIFKYGGQRAHRGHFMTGCSAFVINLESREDRRTEMRRQLRRIGWSAELYRAVQPPDAGGFPSIGARGCFLSHLNVLKRGRLQDQHVLIMEDDLNFSIDFPRLWPQAFNELQDRDWSIFYPAHYLKTEPNGLKLIDPSLNILCTHFIMIHRNVVATVIHGLEAILSRPPGHPLGGPMHVDGAYSTIRAQNPDMKTYIFSPALGYQRSSRSDVADQKAFDRIKFLRPIVGAVRTLKMMANNITRRR
jgi:glycosyl transferase family 25